MISTEFLVQFFRANQGQQGHFHQETNLVWDEFDSGILFGRFFAILFAITLDPVEKEYYIIIKI